MRVRLLAAALALALPVAGGIPLRVTEPANGEVLRGGSLATISWTPADTLPPKVVEWEAFLSVDGGCYYATRITPHLDIDIRTFEFRVPNVASTDVRLLIRIGDEIDEKSVDVPLRLSIVADPLVPPPMARFATGRGESARRGDRGVALWVTGKRNGREAELLRAPVEDILRPITLPARVADHDALETPLAAVLRVAWTSTATPAAAVRDRAFAPLLARDILLLVRRRNI
jgi:hypothetical protein